MGHQDSHLELRAMLSRDEALPPSKAGRDSSEEIDKTPLLLDHDAVPSWRETARYFRKAA